MFGSIQINNPEKYMTLAKDSGALSIVCSAAAIIAGISSNSDEMIALVPAIVPGFLAALTAATAIFSATLAKSHNPIHASRVTAGVGFGLTILTGLAADSLGIDGNLAKVAVGIPSTVTFLGLGSLGVLAIANIFKRKIEKN